MKTTLALLVLVAAAAGCTSLSKSSTTKLEWTDGAKVLRWSSPKDISVESMGIDPETGMLSVKKLSSQVDQAAVQAAKEVRMAESDAMKAMLDAFLKMALSAYTKTPIP